MATTKDSNKLTIYKGGDKDYAFIPLDISENTHYDFTNSIIYNDGSTYIKNITSDSELYKLVKDKLLDASAPAIRDKQEDPKKPLSDSKLASLLEAEGINVARRTVAKYRESLDIPSSSDRKQRF